MRSSSSTTTIHDIHVPILLSRRWSTTFVLDPNHNESSNTTGSGCRSLTTAPIITHDVKVSEGPSLTLSGSSQSTDSAPSTTLLLKKKKRKRWIPRPTPAVDNDHDTDTVDTDNKKDMSKNRLRALKLAMEVHDSIATYLTREQFLILKKWLRTVTMKTKSSMIRGNVANKFDVRWNNPTTKEGIDTLPLWVHTRFKLAMMKRMDDGYLVLREESFSTEPFPSPVESECLENFDDKVSILMKARDFSLQNNVYWSKFEKNLKQKHFTNSKGNEGTRKDADDVNTAPSETPANEQHALLESKSNEQQQQEAEDHLRYLAKTLAPEYLDAWISELKNLIESESDKRGSKALSVFLYRCMPSHKHLVARKIAQFFNHTISAPEEWEPQLVSASKIWERQRDKFSRQLINLHDLIHIQTIPPATQGASDDDEVDIDLALNPLADIVIPKGRSFHLFLDTMLPQNMSSSVPHSDDITQPEELPLSVPHSDKMVFVDNLPVDMTETELISLFSRCGPLLKVRIFNQRPDLDPGPLSHNELKARNKRQRMNRFKSVGARWRFPRTPVYAIITFGTPEGYALAMDTQLRIFGMVVRKHAMRTTAVKDQCTLHVDHIPPGLAATDLEYALHKDLGELVYLWMHRQPQRISDVTSCEIKFPSFEVAYLCYDLVRDTMERLCDRALELAIEEKKTEPDQNGCAIVDHNRIPPTTFHDGILRVNVNFFRTPEDAVMYWTRRKGFEV